MGFLQQQEIRYKEDIRMKDMERSDIEINYREVCAEN